MTFPRCAASKALSVASIASLVLDYLAIVDGCRIIGQTTLAGSIRQVRRTLLLTSLISPTFRALSQKKLQHDLLFDRGTRQMKQWLAFAGKRGPDWVNREVLFIEKPEEEEEEKETRTKEEDVKPMIIEWDVAVLMVVLRKLKKPEVLWLQLESLSKLPAEAFSLPNLKSVKNFELPVPLTSSLTRPSFSPEALFLHDRVPLPNNYGEHCGKLHICCLCGSQHHGAIKCPLVRWGLPADWTNTIRLFAPLPHAPESERLDHLSLLKFPYFALYVRDLLNLVPNLSSLALPSLEEWTQRSRHACTLLGSCHSLQELFLSRLPEPEILLSLLRAVPRTAPLRFLAFEWLVGKLGADHPQVHPNAYRYCDCDDCREMRDPVAELGDLFEPLAERGVREMVVHNAKHVSLSRAQKLKDEAWKWGIELMFGTLWVGLTCCEQSELDRLIEHSTALFAEASLDD
ncbi:hypothetical protein JCM11251_000387 [Rhodosporidiobolus azoricus]